jgi:hypothetical protein
VKIYKLTNSKYINKIFTHVTTISSSLANSHLRIHYLNKELGRDGIEHIDNDELILKTIKDLLNSQLIDNKLASALYQDYPHLLDGKTLTVPETLFVSSYTCKDLSQFSSNMNKEEQVALVDKPMSESKPVLTPRYQFFTSPFMSSRAKVSKQEKKQLNETIIKSLEQEEMKEAMSNSIQSADMLEVAQHLYTEEVNMNFLSAAVEKSLEKKSLKNFYKSKFAKEIQCNDLHKISNYTCKFKYDDKGLLLIMSFIEGDNESLQISAKNKEDILDCHNLPALIKILYAIKHGPYLAELIEYYEESKVSSNFNV